LFAGFFLWALWRYRQTKKPLAALFLLPLIEIAWANTHIYFLAGPLLIAVFLFEELISPSAGAGGKKEVKLLTAVLAATVLAALVNPFGAKLIFYPLTIFQNYGYRLVENQSVWFLEKLNFAANPNFLFLKIVSLTGLASFVLIFLKKRSSFSIANFCLFAGLAAAAFLALRNFAIFAFFSLPIIACNLKILFAEKIKKREMEIASVAIIVWLLTLFLCYDKLPLKAGNFGLGLKPTVNQAAEFFKKEKIRGPIFNNYDIGGYLIYHLFPKERVFVDNRPEAYPSSFFQDAYIPMQEKEDVWRKEEKKYRFNAIFFYRLDATPWAQSFLIRRIKDSNWVPVFVDRETIIFLKNNKANQEIISRYQIPRKYFKIKNI
jgi:hypothetical protein